MRYISIGYSTAVQGQKAVSAYFRYCFAVQSSVDILCLLLLLKIKLQYDANSSLYKQISILLINPLTAKLFNLNFHPPEVVSRWRDPQLQVIEIYSDLTKWRQLFSNIAD